MEFVVGSGGDVECLRTSCAALVRNKARLNYGQVAAWLEKPASMPAELRPQLSPQQEASRRLKAFRQEHGALTLGGVESVPIVVNNTVRGFGMVHQDEARDIIESFMIAANVAMAGHLRARNSLCLRRVVRTPKR